MRKPRRALRAGVNFVLGQPLIPDKIANIFALSTTMMTSEKRRYSRYPAHGSSQS